jgi:hypothetical protein
MANKPGHPIVYPDSVFHEILRRHGEGENVLKILREEGMPQWSTFFLRCMSKQAPEELSTAYASAHEAWVAKKLHEADEISDAQEEGVEETVSDGPKGVTTTVKKSDMLGHRQLKVKTRLWFAERLMERYAKKNVLQNPDGSAVVFQPVVQIVPFDPAKKSNDG